MCFVLVSCEVYSFIDTNSPIIVSEKIGNDTYVVDYNYSNRRYFMKVISNENWEEGDTLILTKKKKR